LSAAIKKGQTFIPNVYWDVVRYGTGLTVTSAAADQITLEDIYAVDDLLANKYGVVQKSAGAYVLNGNITLGGTSTQTIDFIADGEVILFPDNELVGVDFNSIIALGNATGTTNVEFSGSFIKANNKKCTFDFDGANLDTILIAGNSFVNVAPSFATTQDIINNVFGSCEQIIVAAGTVFTGNTVKETIDTTAAILYPNSATNFKNNTFLDNVLGAAIEVNVSITQTFDNLKFSGNTDDVNNTSSLALIINLTNGSNATSQEGAAITFNNSVTVTLTGVIEGSEISIQRTGTQTVEGYVASSAANGEFAYTFNSPPVGFTHIDVFIVKPGYEWYPTYSYELPVISAALPINQQTDRNYVV